MVVNKVYSYMGVEDSKASEDVNCFHISIFFGRPGHDSPDYKSIIYPLPINIAKYLANVYTFS